jgi:hypothetical protein
MLMVTFRRPQPPAEDIPIYNGRGCTLLELSQGKCRWPISNPGAEDFFNLERPDNEQHPERFGGNGSGSHLCWTDKDAVQVQTKWAGRRARSRAQEKRDA